MKGEDSEREKAEVSQAVMHALRRSDLVVNAFDFAVRDGIDPVVENCALECD